MIFISFFLWSQTPKTMNMLKFQIFKIRCSFYFSRFLIGDKNNLWVEKYSQTCKHTENTEIKQKLRNNLEFMRVIGWPWYSYGMWPNKVYSTVPLVITHLFYRSCCVWISLVKKKVIHSKYDIIIWIFQPTNFSAYLRIESKQLTIISKSNSLKMFFSQYMYEFFFLNYKVLNYINRKSNTQSKIVKSFSSIKDKKNFFFLNAKTD